MKTSDSRDRKVEKRNRKQWKSGGKGWIGAVHNARWSTKKTGGK